MKKSVAISLLLFLVLFLSVSAQVTKKDSIRIKLVKDINSCLDSIVRNNIYTLDYRGYKYYRFSRGVFVSHSDQIIGEFAAPLKDSVDVWGIRSLNRVSFRSCNGEISFNYFDCDGEPYSEKTTKQLLFAIREYW